jgi:alpha-beta hydrolase superfamily lysophospholipase
VPSLRPCSNLTKTPKITSKVHWPFYVLILVVVVYAVIVLIYYLLQEKLLFVGRPLKRKFKFQLATPFEEVFLESAEGGTLHALHLKLEEPKGLILYFHGNTGNMNRWSPVAEELTTYNFDVLVVDYRGFGKSSGRRSEETLHQDAQQIYDYALTLVPKEKLVVYGRSLGSGLAVKVAAENSPDRLVLETPYYHLLGVVFHHFPFLPVRLILRYHFRSDKWMPKVTCPVIIFHGTKDRIVPYKSGLKLYNRIDKEVDGSMVTLAKGKHGNLNQFPLFREKMHDFLADVG